MMILSIRLRIVLIIWSSSSMVCEGSFYSYRYQGFHGYESLTVHRKKPLETPEHMRQCLETLLHRAYAQPTFQKVLDYLRMQKRHMGKSQAFARMWERVLWAYPELDERAHSPVSHPGIGIYREEMQHKSTAFLKHYAQHYCLCVVVDDTVYSHTFMQIVERFCQEYGWTARYVSRVSLKQEKKLPILQDKEVVDALGVHMFPALFMMHRQRPFMVRLGAGCMSMSAVVHRVKESLYDVLDAVDQSDHAGSMGDHDKKST